MTSQRNKPGGRREPPGGRPPKGNTRLVCYVRPQTRKAIEEEAEKMGATFGEVVDQLASRTRELKAAIAWIEQLESTGQGYKIDDTSAPTAAELLPQLRAAIGRDQ